MVVMLVPFVPIDSATSQVELVDPVEQVGNLFKKLLQLRFARPASDESIAVSTQDDIEKDALDGFVDELFAGQLLVLFRLASLHRAHDGGNLERSPTAN